MLPSRASAHDRADPRTPVGEVFANLASELERARSLGLRVEGAICAIAVRSSLTSDVIYELQQLDAMLQHVAALRDFAAELARQVVTNGNVATVEALDRITLGDVRMRLGGARMEDDPTEDWEMF